MNNVKSKAKSEYDGNIYQFPRKSIEQVFAECAMRVRKLENTPEIEKNALIAICEGNIKEADRLLEIAKKMKKNHMTVI